MIYIFLVHHWLIMKEKYTFAGIFFANLDIMTSDNAYTTITWLFYEQWIYEGSRGYSCLFLASVDDHRRDIRRYDGSFHSPPANGIQVALL